MPPIRFGSTDRVASTVRPDARSIWSRIWRASSSESSYAVVSSTLSRRSSCATSRSNSRWISRSWPARFFSIVTRRKFRTSSWVPPRIACTAPAFARGSICGFRRSASSSGTCSTISMNSRKSSRTFSSWPRSCAASKSARAYVRCATLIAAPFADERVEGVWENREVRPQKTGRGSVGPTRFRPRERAQAAQSETRRALGSERRSRRLLFQAREVERVDRLVDQPPLVGVGQHLAGHLRRRDQRQVRDLGPNRAERPLRLRLDLALRLLEPAAAVLLELLAGAFAKRLRVAADVLPDSLRLRPRLRDQLAVLLEQLARLLAGAIGLGERLADPLTALVDHLLDRAEGEPLEDEERHEEADDRPDHQAGDDLDQRVGAQQAHQTRTKASSPPIRP